jgi:dienelactone hydrolase
MEKQISIKVEGLRLFGMLHLPEGTPPFPALSLFHGFGGTRIEPHRLFVKTSRWLAREGIASLRLDFRGSGESEGDFKSMTLSGEIQDAKAALNFLRAQTEVKSDRLGVLGLSMGGYVAASVAAQDPTLKALVLWSASARGATYFHHYHHLSGKNRKDWEITGERDFGGNLLSSAFLQDGVALPDPLPALRAFQGKALILHGEKDATVPLEEAQLFKKALGDQATLQIVKGADHTFNKTAWENELMQSTVTWAKAHLAF